MTKRYAHDPIDPKRHDKFQFGTNPDHEDSFEKRLILQERSDRAKVRLKQTLGIQGRDGGRCYDKEIDRGEYF